MSSFNGLRAWAEVDLGALAHNIRTLQTFYGDTGVMAIVKADAYGHGVDLVAPCAYANGIRHFGVATTEEGLYLRRLLRADAHVYVLSPVIPSDAPAIVSDRLIPAVSSIEMAEALSEAVTVVDPKGYVNFHLDIDTGMGRSGFQTAEALDALAKIEALPGLRCAGVCTHFASADEDVDDARAQHQLFVGLLSTLPAPDGDGYTVHASNSPATLVLGNPAFHTLVRPGLLMYGIEPAPGMLADMDLRPVLSIKARVTLCRDLPAGATVSYGKTYTVPDGGGCYATIALGYGDGYQRAFGNTGYVLLNGKRAPIRGRVCMDQFVVDVSGICPSPPTPLPSRERGAGVRGLTPPQPSPCQGEGVRAGDIATIVGRDGDEEITIGAMADLIKTTPHLISTCLLPRLPRMAVKG